MTFLTQLDVVNDMLAALGEHPLNTLEDDHPLTASGLRMIRTANLREQSKSWWFNQERITLTPDPISGIIVTPGDTIRVDPTDTTLNYVQRGRRLYKAYARPNEDRYKFDRPVECWLVRLIEFDDLPSSAQSVVSLAAQVDFTKFYDADPVKYQQIVGEYREALRTLTAEHIRNANVNLLRRPSMQRALNAMAPVYSGLPLYR